MTTLRFTESHEWVRVDGSEATVGITDHAQSLLGDVVFVELPTVGSVVTAGAAVAVVESVKAASEVYSPVSGTITAVNDALDAAPDHVNSDAAGEGWFFKLTLSNPGELDGLMDEAAYTAHSAE